MNMTPKVKRLRKSNPGRPIEMTIGRLGVVHYLTDAEAKELIARLLNAIMAGGIKQ